VTIEQGANWQLTATWKDSAGAAVNLTGYTARLKVKDKYGGTQLLSITSSDSITLGGAAGTITINVAAATTAALAAPASGVYDLELVSGAGVVTRLLEGTVKIAPEVTT
jgi:hypothetical protein